MAWKPVCLDGVRTYTSMENADHMNLTAMDKPLRLCVFVPYYVAPGHQ
jgi:hypothetical protein